MLTAKLIKRLEDEVVAEFEFELDTTREELRNAAKYLRDELKATDDDIVNLIKGIATAVAEEYGA